MTILPLHSKETKFTIFLFIQEEVAKELGIPVQCQRFWLWAKRQNHTYRPNRPLTPLEEAQSVCAFDISHRKCKGEIVINMSNPLCC